MSVQNYLLRRKPYKELLDTEIGLPLIKKKDFALQILPKGKNNIVLGIAFDYALRFLLKFEFQEKVEFKEPNILIAVSGLNDLRNRLAHTEVFNTFKDKTSVKHQSQRILDRLNLADSRTSLAVTHYFKNGSLEKPYLESLFFYAYMDIFFRGGLLYESFDKIELSDIDELSELISSVDLNLFRAKKVIELNPDFGLPSKFIKGADADLIVDGLLLDIKLVQDLSHFRQYFNQVFTYYLLAKIEGIKEISSLGFYFARHCRKYEIPVSEIAPAKSLAKVQKWLDKDLKYLNGVGRNKKKITKKEK